jgi:hypothetical protein
LAQSACVTGGSPETAAAVVRPPSPVPPSPVLVTVQVEPETLTAKEEPDIDELPQKHTGPPRADGSETTQQVSRLGAEALEQETGAAARDAPRNQVSGMRIIRGGRWRILWCKALCAGKDNRTTPRRCHLHDETDGNLRASPDELAEAWDFAVYS